MTILTDWHPGKYTVGLLVGKQLPLGYSIQENPNLIAPYYISNTKPFREVMAREGGFAFPLAGAGFFVGGPVGVVGGHVLGALLGYVRHQRVHSVEG